MASYNLIIRLSSFLQSIGNTHTRKKLVEIMDGLYELLGVEPTASIPEVTFVFLVFIFYFYF